MRKLIALATLILCVFTTEAQKGKNDPNLPAFGKIEKSDLELKECSFDEKADALILVNEGQLDFIYGSGMELKKRVRIKILNNHGLEQANIHLRYLSERGLEDITGLEAQTYNLDATGNVVVSKVEKKLIVDKRLNKRVSERIFTFPEAKVGSIIEYKYKHSGIGLIDWYFQYSIPVKFSKFVIDFPEDIEVHCTPHCSRNFTQNFKSEGRRTVKEYSMTDCPGFRDEPYIINEDFYRDRLQTKVIAWTGQDSRRNSRIINWVQVIRALMDDEDFGVQIKKNIPRTADLDEKLKVIKGSYDRMKTIYKYVQDNMVWNEYVGIWAFDGVKAAWKDKKGTVGEINLILVNLLKDAGLDAQPVLVSTHNNGIVNSTDAGTYDNPGFRQFNKVMAYVNIDERTFVLDATEKETPAHLFPPDILMTEGLVIEKIDTYEWGWKTLWNPGLMNKTVIVSRGEIDANGKMIGESTISSYDYARLDRLPIAKKGKDKFIEKYGSSNSGISIDDVKFDNLESDSLPLVQQVKFTENLNSSGDYRYFSANILSGLDKNPFVADNRFSDIFFGTNQNYLMMGSFVLPEGYEFDELPKNVKMIMPDTSISISRIAQVSGNVLMTKIQIDFRSPVYAAAQYAEFQEFYKQLFQILNEQFVVKKKKG